MIGQLWLSMATLYGGTRWASAACELPFKSDGQLTAAAAVWSRALTGITEKGIANGLAACISSIDEFVPSPRLFRARCLGIPPLSFVRLALRKDTTMERTPFVCLVWSFIDSYRYARVEQRVADLMVHDAYALAAKHVIRGGALPEPPVAVLEAAQPVHKPASEATARRSLNELGELLGMSTGLNQGAVP